MSISYNIYRFLKGDRVATRRIRVFISSTFSDMIQERDTLINNVFPMVQSIAAKRYVTIEPVDLRWGITESEAKSGHTVGLCLDEIERSRPFFIGMVGDRYGWCPDEHEVNLDNHADKESILSDLRDRLSITEVEMRYGALRNPENVKCSFYLKTTKGEPQAEQLKDTIRSSYGIIWHDYNDCGWTSGGLAKLVHDDLINLLDTLYPEDNSNSNNLSFSFAYHLASCLRFYADTESDAAQAIDALYDDYEPAIIAINGPHGSGKTTLMAKNLLGARAEYYGIGTGGASASSDDILDYFAREMAYTLNIELAPGKPRERIVSILKQLDGYTYYLLYIDNIDLLDENDSTLDWLPQLPDGVKIVLGVTDAGRFDKAFTRKGIRIYQMQPITADTLASIAARTLSNAGKKLPEDLLQMIVTWPLSSNLKLTRALLSLLESFGNHESLRAFTTYLLEATDSADFYRRMCKDLSRRHSDIPIHDILALICLSCDGLTEHEICGMTGLTPLKWAEFYGDFSRMLDSASGLLCITDSELQQAILGNLSADNIKEYRCKITSYFIRQSKILDYCLNQTFDNNGNYDFTLAYDQTISLTDIRPFLECAHQGYALGDNRLLFGSVIYLGAFEALYNRNPQLLLLYWHRLLTDGYRLESYDNSLCTLADNKTDGMRIYYKLGSWIIDNFDDKSAAIPFYESIYNFYSKLGDKDKNGIAPHVAGRLSILYSMKGDNEKADYYLDRSMHGNDEQKASAFINKGRNLTDSGQHEEALDAFDHGIDIYSRLAQDNEAHYIGDVGRALNNKSRALKALGREKEAMWALDESLRLLKKAYTYDASLALSLARSYYNNALTLHQTHDDTNIPKALEYYTEAANLFAEGCIDWCLATLGIGECQQLSGNNDEAIHYFRKVKDLAMANELYDCSFEALGWMMYVIARNGENDTVLMLVDESMEIYKLTSKWSSEFVSGGYMIEHYIGRAVEAEIGKLPLSKRQDLAVYHNDMLTKLLECIGHFNGTSHPMYNRMSNRLHRCQRWIEANSNDSLTTTPTDS